MEGASPERRVPLAKGFLQETANHKRRRHQLETLALITYSGPSPPASSPSNQ